MYQDTAHQLCFTATCFGHYQYHADVSFIKWCCKFKMPFEKGNTLPLKWVVRVCQGKFLSSLSSCQGKCKVGITWLFHLSLVFFLRIDIHYSKQIWGFLEKPRGGRLLSYNCLDSWKLLLGGEFSQGQIKIKWCNAVAGFRGAGD